MSGAPDGVVELLVCVKCRQGEPAEPEEVTRGARLHGALAERNLPENIRLIPVECLSNCTRGCTVALRGPGRWTYVYGNLDASHAPVLAEGALKYRDAPDGLVPWRERPEHFRKNCIVRIPPLEGAQ
ncbi:DUF1636 family protein [Rhodovulum adriaticum]|uniref:Putative metal-binding protein n=1 Tax=Rhodovulum adriaticum TaxID=35804 RepID=A0A4R2NU09_RHOAD|nr:DUF1636 domain-containing protein [Rhodovulum adriaticum]MBK1636439.1 metal-binding protein [Rhodovulum adriaticum]TCP25559.1 putative metal-binding protein [Rhodovulum adriaticum]